MPKGLFWMLKNEDNDDWEVFGGSVGYYNLPCNYVFGW